MSLTPPPSDLVVTDRRRPGARLLAPGLEVEPSPESVGDACRGLTRVVLRGGEPTLRPDLPAVIAAAAGAGADVVLRTDGLALGRASALSPLVGAGLSRLRVLFAAGRPDAHDWLMGVPGGARAAARAIKGAASLPLPVEAEIPIARPNAALLPETVTVAARMGVDGVVLRLLLAPDVHADERVAILAEPPLLRAPLAEAERAARRLGLSWRIEQLPADLTPPPPPAFDPVVTDLRGSPRTLKIALLRSSAGAPALRVVAVEHPEAASLLREAARMGFARVDVDADLSPLCALDDDELRRLRRISSFRSTVSDDRVADLLRRLARINPETELRS